MLFWPSLRIINLEKHKYTLALSIRSESNGIWITCSIAFVMTYLSTINFNCANIGRENKQPRANSRFLMTRNSKTTLSWNEIRRLRSDSVGARPPAFSPAAVSSAFRALATREARPKGSWALIGSFESLRAI